MKNLNLNDAAIREAAYFIWKNNGCPANTSAQDWNAAINQLTLAASLKNVAKSSTAKTATCKALSMKKTSTKTAAKTTSKSSASKAKKSK